MRKQDRQQRYDQIREMYEPVVKAKDYAMRQMIETGKRMGKLRYLMLAVLFIFLFTYHFFFAIFTQLKMREKLARALSLVMVVVLVFTGVDVTAFAASRTSEESQKVQAEKIIAIEELPEEVLYQTLKIGATEDQIQFPETLSVTIAQEDATQDSGTAPATTVDPAQTTDTPETTTEPAQPTDAPEATAEPAQPTDAPEATTEPAQPTDAPEATTEPAQPTETSSTPEEAAQESENPAENGMQEDPAGAEPAAEVSDAGQILSELADFLFPAMKAYAAEEAASGENVEIPVTWEMDADQSSGDHFSAETGGEYYTYLPVLPEGYELADGVGLPVIQVQIEVAVAVYAVPVTLYTGGGRITETPWMETAVGSYTYTSGTGDVPSVFPTPTVADTLTAFDGWYADKNYAQKADVPQPGGIYYAKWIRTASSTSGSTMKYEYTYNGINSQGVISGNGIQTTFFNAGYALYYAENNANPSNGGASVSVSTGGDVFRNVTGDLYVAQMASIEGAYTRYTYYIWNRGDSAVTQFNIGVAADIQIGNNDYASLYLEQDEIGSYVSMIDGNNELRLYYAGQNAGVSDVSTLWTGRYPQHRYNVFNENRQNQEKLDSTLAMSWKNITIPAHGVVMKTFILGCGEKGTLVLKKTITVDNGDGTTTTTTVNDDEPYTVPGAVSKDGYYFRGWNTAEDGSGDTYQPGDVLYPEEDVRLYPVWEAIRNTAVVEVLLDGEAWTGRNVTLRTEGNPGYELTQKDGSYQSEAVLNGTYEIYVDGRKSDRTITLAASVEAVSARQTVNYHNVTVTTTLDGSASSVPGAVVLRKNNEDVYEMNGSDGVYTCRMQESEGSYDIFVNGEDTGVDISAADPRKTIAYYKMQVNVTDDTPWEDARVELRDASGRSVAVLSPETVNGNTVTYSIILPATGETLYVYVDNKAVHKTLQMETLRTADVTYYTARVNLQGDFPAETQITMTNGTENITLSGALGTYTAEHVFCNTNGDGIEKAYTVTVQNIIDETPEQINSTDREKTLQIHKVDFYRESDLLHTAYVRNGNKVPAYQAVGLTGYTFSCWSKQEWTKEYPEAAGEAFDFSGNITESVTLYANYDTPSLSIGEPLYTKENGELDGSGAFYRMGNLTIKGFDPGESAIKYIFLQSTNTEKILFSNIGGYDTEITNGSETVSVTDGTAAITSINGRVAVTFNTPVSMAAAQDFLREHIIVQPKQGEEHTMMVTVMDASGEYKAVNGVVAATSENATGTELTGNTAGDVALSGTESKPGVYYITGDVTYGNSNSGKNGLIINGTVYLYIPKGNTLTVYGGNGSGSTPGKAAIKVPQGSTLIILGEGTVVAQGGNAGNGGNGGNGGNASFSNDSAYVYPGKGGAGGAGGGGAGAGIGTDGGNGGSASNNGGSSPANVSTEGNANGLNGGSGSKGSNALTMGDLLTNFPDNIRASGGMKGEGGKGGTRGNSSNLGNYKWSYRAAQGGAGGGGGGGGLAAQGIGTGGAGGGQGGGGGSAGYQWTQYYVGAGGGGGGYPNGAGGSSSQASAFSSLDSSTSSYINQSGTAGTGTGASGAYTSLKNPDGGNITRISGGNGGNGGSAGTASASRTPQTPDQEPVYSISFITENENATKPDSQEYILGRDDNKIIFPEYVDSTPNVVFYGWKLSNAPAGSNLDPNRYYKTGEEVTLNAYTTGDIAFTAVTEITGGIHAKDDNTLTITATPNVTYYTYTVSFTVDDSPANMGTIQIGDAAVTPSADGTYCLVVAQNAEATTVPDARKIVVNGAEVGTTAPFSDRQSVTTIAYETLKVQITGKMPRSVQLTGEYAPVLQSVGNGLYQVQRLVAEDKGNYAVWVDGTNVGKTASYGATTEVAYHTVTIQPETNLGAEDIISVELRDAQGNALLLDHADNDERKQYALTRLENSTVYTVYVNGEATQTKVDFSKDQTVAVQFYRYTTRITTQVDGVPADLGSVTFGTDSMIRTGTGQYELISSEPGNAELKVDGSPVRESVAVGSKEIIDYYTLHYAPSGEEKETGEAPQDGRRYPAGSTATLAGRAGLTNGGKTFTGWKNQDTTYAAGQQITMNGTVTVTAVWAATDIGSADVVLADTQFVYNGRPQTPQVTVRYQGTVLHEGTDYTLTYENTNKDAGRSDENGSAETNAVNAGIVTVAVNGRGDFTGTFSGESTRYTIQKKTLTVENLRAQDRTYDGTNKVTVLAEEATLSGVVAGDDVRMQTASVGTMYSPNARNGKVVRLSGSAQLTGSAASNYELNAPETVTVNITPKQLTADMFTLPESVVYNGQEQCPAVNAVDEVSDGSGANAITSDDYRVTYSSNVHAGQAQVTITARETEGEDCNYTGTVTKTFTITPAQLTITAIAAGSIYGAEIAEVTDKYTVTGTIYTEEDKADLDIHAETSVRKGYRAGNYTGAVTIAYNKSNADYEVLTIAADYTVTAAGEISAAARSYVGIYDGKEHGIQVDVTSDSTNDEETIYYSTQKELTDENYKTDGTTTKPVFTNVGTRTVYYYITSMNYQGISGSATVQIEKAPLTVKAKDRTIIYGQGAEDITGGDLNGVEVNGLAAGETKAEVLNGNLQYSSTDYKKYDDVGSYTLLPEGLTADNYEISYTAGLLTVEPKKVRFIWSTDTQQTYTGNTQGIYATVDKTDLVHSDTVTVGSYRDNTAVSAGTYHAKVVSLAGEKAGNYTFVSDETEQEWTIGQAQNAWTKSPEIAGWSEGTKVVPEPVAAAKFGTEIQYTYAAKPDGDSEPAEDAYKAEKPTKAGTYYMKAAVVGTENYTGLVQTVKFTVKEASETPKTILRIVAKDQTITYGNGLETVEAYYTDEKGDAKEVNAGELKGTLSYVTGYQPGNSATGKVGTYSLALSGVTSDVYDIVFVPGTLTVEQKKVTLTWSETALTYNGREQSVTASVKGESLVNGDIVYVSAYTDNTGTNVGNHTATATGLTGTNAENYCLPVVEAERQQSWSIAKAENDFLIQPSMKDWTYGEEVSDPMAAARFGEVTYQYQKVKDGILDWSIFNPKTSEVPTEAGTYRLIAGVAEDENGNYDRIESKEVTFTIAPAEVAVIAQDKASSYGEVIAGLTYETSILKGKLSEADLQMLNVRLSTEAENGSPAGVYPITVTATGNDNMKVTTTVDALYRITPAQLAVTAQDVQVTYDGKAHSIAAPVVTAEGTDKAVKEAVIYYSTEPLNAADYGTGSLTPPEAVNAGETSVYYYVTADNYVPAAGSCKLVIDPKKVTVTAGNAEIVFGEEDVNTGVTFDGFVSGDTADSLGITDKNISYSYLGTDGNTYTKGSSAGTYRIYPEVKADGLTGTSNYQFVPQAGTLTVTKKPLTEDMFTVNDSGFIYDKTAKEPEAVPAGVDKNLKDTDYKVSYRNNIHAGTDTAYAVIEASENGNYSGTVEVAFSIAPCEITITAKEASSEYKQAVGELQYEITSGSIVNGDDLKLKAVTSVKKGYAAGRYEDAVSVNYDTKNADYKVTVIPAAYTVTKAALQVTAQGYEGVYDGKSHTGKIAAKTGEFLTFATIYYSSTETVTADNYESMETACPEFTDAGIYTINYYAVCENYEPVSGSVTVQISKAPLTVTAGTLTQTYGVTAEMLKQELENFAQQEDAYRCDGFVGKDTKETVFGNQKLRFTTDYQAGDDAGEYALNISAGSVAVQNYDLTLLPGTLTMQPKKVTFTWNGDKTFGYNGNEQGVQATVEDTVNGDRITVGSYVTDLTAQQAATATAAGSYTAIVKALAGAKADNYIFDPADSNSRVSWQIQKAENSFTVEPSISSWTEGKTPAQPVASAKYGQVKFYYSTAENGTYKEEIPDDAKAGNYRLKVVVEESSNYKGLEQVVPFEIKEKNENRTTITITAHAIKDMTYGETFDSSQYGPDQLTVTGLPEGRTLNEIVDGTLTFTTDYTEGSSAGSYLLVPGGLTVKEEMKDTSEIVYVPGTFTVNKKAVTLNWPETTEFVYDGREHGIEVSVNAQDLVPGDSILVTDYAYDETENVRNTAVNVGTYTARVTRFSGTNSNNYVIDNESVTKQWSIRKASAGTGETGEGNRFLMSPVIHDWTYGETPSVPESMSRFGTPEYYYSNAVDGEYSRTQPTQAGSWYLKARVAGTGNYDTIESEAVPFTIRKAKLTLTAADVTSTYGADLAELTYTMDGEIVGSDDLGIRITTTAGKQTPAGEYPITISCNNDPNYEITVINGTYVILPQAGGLQVTAAGYTGTYDGEAHGILVTVKDSDGKAAENAVVYYSDTTELTASNYGSGSTTCPVLQNAGEKTVYYYVTADNCEPVAGAQKILIDQKLVTVTAQNAEIVYGEAPKHEGAVYDGFVGGDTAESLGLEPDYTYNYARYQNAGSYQIIPQGLAENGNYRYLYESGVLQVTPKPVTLKWSQTGFTYDGTVKSVTARIQGLEAADIVEAEYEGNTAVHAGEYTATVRTLTGTKADSYTIDGEPTASVSWKINRGNNYLKTPLVMANMTYGDAAVQPEGSVAYGEGEILYSNSKYGTYTTEQPVEAGTYFVKIKAAQTADYDAFESAPVSFVITPAELVVTADDKAGKAGSEIKELTYTITSGKLFADDEIRVELATTATENSQVGTYPITISAEAGSNYSVLTVDGNYYVTDREIDLRAEGVNCTYDGKEHGISVMTGSDEAKVYYSLQQITGAMVQAQSNAIAETSPVRVTVGTTRVYYAVADADGTLLLHGSKDITINKAPLIVTAKDITISRGDAPYGNGVLYDGFVNGEDETVLRGNIMYRFDYSQGQKDGTYSIQPSGLQAENYEIVYRPGVLTVTPVREEIAITGVTAREDLVYDGQNHIGFDGTPKTDGNAVTEFEYIYKDGQGNVIGTGLENAPKDAGNYTVIIRIPDTNVYYSGEKEIAFTIAKRQIRILPRNQAMMTGQNFAAAEPVYEGFLGTDNENGQAIATKASVAPETGADLTKPGKVELVVTDVGSLTTAAAVNYELDGNATAVLTVIAVPDNPGKDESGSSIKLDDPDSGIIKITVIKEQENLPRTEIEADFSIEVAEALLDETELDAVRGGQNALIYLLLSKADRTMTEEEKQKITAAAESLAGNARIGLYLDLSLYKKVGDATPKKITQTGEQKVTIEITLPESLKVKDSNVERTYHIIYVHDGETHQITPEYRDGVLKFEADEFSVYAIVYKDTAKSSGGGDNPGGETPTPVPGDTPGGNTPAPAPGDTDTTPTPAPGSDITTPVPGGTPTPIPGDNTPEPDDITSDDGNSGDDSGHTPAVTPAPGSAVTPATGTHKPGNGKKTENENTPVNTPDIGDTPSATAAPGQTEQPAAPGQTEQPTAPGQTETIRAAVTDKLPAETKKRLEDAVKKIQSVDSGIQAGPYIKPEISNIAENTEGNAQGNTTGTATITVQIPEKLRGEGRTFYLMMTDADGNIIILPNESLVEGTISVTGSADATYQIIYEDGTSLLADMIAEDGRLTGADGKILTVSTNHCLWHWLILVITLLGVGAIALLGRKKKKYIWFFMGVTTVLNLLLAIVGFCVIDWIFLIAGILVMLFLAVILYRSNNDDSHYAVQA